MIIEMISLSISMKVWDQAGVELATPGFAVKLASVARHVTDCCNRYTMACPPVHEDNPRALACDKYQLLIFSKVCLLDLILYVPSTIF